MRVACACNQARAGRQRWLGEFAPQAARAGKVLLLGSHFDHVTLLHHAEHLARIPNKRIVRYSVRTSAGPIVDIEEFDTSAGVVAAMPDAYFESTIRTFVNSGQGRTGPVGGATAYLLDAATLTAFAVERMERDFA